MIPNDDVILVLSSENSNKSISNKKKYRKRPFNTQYWSYSIIVYLVKMDSEYDNIIFGLKMMGVNWSINFLVIFVMNFLILGKTFSTFMNGCPP